MDLKNLEGDELVQHLRQLVISCEPHIREAGSVENVEETLQHLEENDDKFHRYEFVKNLKRKIEEILGPQIDEEIEKHGGQIDNGHETLVSQITDRIIKSKPYNDLSKKLKSNVQEAVAELVKNFDAEFGIGKHNGDTFRHHDAGVRGFGGSDDEDTIDSSFHHGSLMFMKPEYLQQLAEKMGKSNSVTTRREALQSLIAVRVDDVVTSDFVNVIRKQVLDALADSDDQIMNLGLKFVTRAFSSTSPHTKDIYTLLTDHLMSQFMTRKTSIPKVKNGLDITKAEVKRLLKAFRLMNEFQHETTNYWIRYPELYLEEVLKGTLSLLSIHNVSTVGMPQTLSPLHFVALLDTKAQWFIKWMHGNFSRSFLLDHLTSYKQFVENAVKHCLEFSAARKVPFDLMSEISDSMSKASFESRRTSYTGAELEYAYFIHSACVIGKLLCFSNGRKFFPIKLKDSEDPVSIKKLMVALVLVVVDPGPVFHQQRSHAAEIYDPARLVADILKGLCSSEQACEICLFKDEITSTLLSPISHYLDVAYFSIKEHQAPDEKTLLHVADILSMIASSTKGRRHLMYGEKKDIFSRTKSSAAHIIAEFTKKALQRQLPREAGQAPTHAVIGAYLYICRQIYNTCEGLLVLYPYELHAVVAETWRDASRDLESVNTPTPGDDDSGSDNSSITIREAYDVVAWEDTLRDNLLNFASTAKGILLLQQTGALNECMSYMHTRYEKKLQVSKCEKFGYGYMVTQVATTSPGMAALRKTGYMKALIGELWSVIECGPIDITLFTPKSWPVDPIDKSLHKHMIRLLNVLSSFPAVYELLGDTQLPTKQSYGFREIPECMAGLLDRVVFMDSPAKFHSLFNVDQSHMFGLRVLSLMVSCLDSFLMLQSQYQIQEKLLAAQSDNQAVNKDRKEIIVDMLSVERNSILVRTYLVGGPTERVLPTRSLEDSGTRYSFPLFSSFPVPREYSPNLGGRSGIMPGFIYPTHTQGLPKKSDNELTEFLDSRRSEKGKAWVDKCRNLLSKFFASKGDQVKGAVIQKILEQSVNVMSTIPEESVFPLMQFAGNDSTVKAVSLTPLQQLGIKIAIRYGIHLKVVHTSSDATDSLTFLMRQVKFYLEQQQKTPDSQLKYMKNGYTGFDWFAATVFLIFNGNHDRAWDFLQSFSTLGASGYLWIPRLHASVHLPSALSASGIHPLFSSTGHNIEFILQIELPLVSSAFKMSGYTPAQICQHWLTQCFWNYLDWQDVCHYIVVCLIHGVDHQVYVCVAILNHLQSYIMAHMQTHDLIMFLKEEPIHGFKVAQNLKYMLELEKKYRKMVLPDMLNITRP
ncbi:protein broad-minded-like isoform X2 [Dreissena polymorpha]|uniref:protein broad-minded-like isoform X2 n=1 Tax=Dreissena polymorpha TaxID=45954 RepID=UPI0022651AFE|nr:protein broad-minded-like isoform X2 [Dreissena polymorpha]